jgi:hypothetical protein
MVTEPTVWGPGLLPAIVPVVRCVIVKERSTNERKIAEMVMTEEEGVTPECEVVESVTDKTPTGEGCAS